VRGEVIIGAFRTDPSFLNAMMPRSEEKEDLREKTSFVGHRVHISATTRREGPNEVYLALPNEQQMLPSLHRPSWMRGFEIPSFAKEEPANIAVIRAMRDCAARYRTSILEEATLGARELELRHVGKVDPKQFIRDQSDAMAAHQGALLARLHVTRASF